MNNEILNTILSIILPVLTAACAYLIAQIDNKKVKERLKTIEDALNDDETVYYVSCPKCGFKIVLNNIKIKSEKKENESK